MPVDESQKFSGEVLSSICQHREVLGKQLMATERGLGFDVCKLSPNRRIDFTQFETPKKIIADSHALAALHVGFTRDKTNTTDKFLPGSDDNGCVLDPVPGLLDGLAVLVADDPNSPLKKMSFESPARKGRSTDLPKKLNKGRLEEEVREQADSNTAESYFKSHFESQIMNRKAQSESEIKKRELAAKKPKIPDDQTEKTNRVLNTIDPMARDTTDEGHTIEKLNRLLNTIDPMARDTTEELHTIDRTDQELKTIDPMARDTTDELPDLFIRRQSPTQADPNPKFGPESPYVQEVLAKSRLQASKKIVGSPEAWSNSEYFDLEESNFQTNTDNNETQHEIGNSEYSISPNRSNYNTEKKWCGEIRGNKKRIRKRNRPSLENHHGALVPDSPIELQYFTAQPQTLTLQGVEIDQLRSNLRVLSIENPQSPPIPHPTPLDSPIPKKAHSPPHTSPSKADSFGWSGGKTQSNTSNLLDSNSKTVQTDTSNLLDLNSNPRLSYLDNFSRPSFYQKNQNPIDPIPLNLQNSLKCDFH